MTPPLLSVVTLGARDLARLRRFYVGLGWRPAVDLDDFVAFETRGAVLTLYPLDALAADARLAPGAPEHGLRGFTLAMNVERRDEVDEVIDAVQAAGARVTKAPVDAEWGGRSAYFTDPEDNVWEVAWVPPDSDMARTVRRATGVE